MKVPVSIAIVSAGGTGQHLGQLRDARAMTSGVGAFGVDCRGD